MSKEGRTYAIVRWNPGFDRAAFLRAKGQGVIQTSFDTVRKNLAGTEAILCWRGPQPTELNGKILVSTDHAGMLAYLTANSAAWEAPFPRTEQPPTRFARMAAAIKGIAVGPDNVITPLPASPESKWRAWDWLVLATAAAAVGGLIYYFTRG